MPHYIWFMCKFMWFFRLFWKKKGFTITHKSNLLLIQKTCHWWPLFWICNLKQTKVIVVVALKFRLFDYVSPQISIMINVFRFYLLSFSIKTTNCTFRKKNIFNMVSRAHPRHFYILKHFSEFAYDFFADFKFFLENSDKILYSKTHKWNDHLTMFI